jgi:hypothetical protein
LPQTHADKGHFFFSRATCPAKANQRQREQRMGVKLILEISIRSRLRGINPNKE